LAQVRVREVVGALKVVDSDALLSPMVLERIVNAVIRSIESSREDEKRRRSDVRIGACCDDCEEAQS
jgi:hypothetical protein